VHVRGDLRLLLSRSFHFNFVRHAHEEAVSASWTMPGSTITLQTLQMPPWVLRSMTTICTIGSFMFLMASLLSDQFFNISSRSFGVR
jgi:hypothetical protein